MTTKSLAKTLNQLIGDRESLGQVLRSIRLCDELSLREFAETLNISTSYLSDIEHGRRLVSARKAYKYAEKLSYPIEEFIRLALQDEANSFIANTGHHVNVSLSIS